MRGAVPFVVAALLAALPTPGRTDVQKREFVIIFGTTAAGLTPQAQAIVKLIAERAAAEQPAAIDIAGYGDSDAADDRDLADRRAETVIHALIEAGVAPGQVKKVPPAPPASATGIPVHKVTATFE